MRSLISILTGLHVLAHGMFGCCDHALTAFSSASNSATADCECHHSHQHAPDDNHAEPHGSCVVADDGQSSGSTPHRCIHASCHWVVASTTDLGQLLNYETSMVSSTAVAPLTSAHSTADFWPTSDPDQLSAPPLRLHLALGVLRI